MDTRRVRVWDLGVRLLHWTLVASVACAWLAAERYPKTHEAAGGVALAAVVLRLAWGFVGSRYARFRQFVRGPGPTARYALAVLRRREPRHIGHNPLGGWMAVTLLGCVGVVAASGWLYTTEAWWGDPRLAALHDGLAWALLALAALHVAGVAYTGWRHRENLVAAMFDGRKRPPARDDVP